MCDVVNRNENNAANDCGTWRKGKGHSYKRAVPSKSLSTKRRADRNSVDSLKIVVIAVTHTFNFTPNSEWIKIKSWSVNILVETFAYIYICLFFIGLLSGRNFSLYLHVFSLSSSIEVEMLDYIYMSFFKSSSIEIKTLDYIYICLFLYLAP